MRIIVFCLFFFFFIASSRSFAQAPLPHIEVKNYNGKIIISWVNKYKRTAKVINIQRSDDSLRDYTTIASMLNPENIDNGYLDAKAPKGKLFYRVFIAFPGGSYAFSEVRRPVMAVHDSLLTMGDSIAMQTPRPVNAKRPRFVFLGRENNVILQLPDTLSKKYAIWFFDERERLVFRIDEISEPELIIDKMNFLHGGWFNYELYDGKRMIDRDKFYLPKDEKGRPGSQTEQGKKNKP